MCIRDRNGTLPFSPAGELPLIHSRNHDGFIVAAEASAHKPETTLFATRDLPRSRLTRLLPQERHVDHLARPDTSGIGRNEHQAVGVHHGLEYPGALRTGGA